MAVASSEFRPDLGALAYEFMTDSINNGFIGTQVMPIVDVANKTGRYPYIPASNFLKLPSITRAPGSDYARREFGFDKKTFDCAEYGIEEPIDDGDQAEYQFMMSLEEVAVQINSDTLIRSHEERVANVAQDTTTISATAVTNEWDDYANATLRSDVIYIGKAGFRAQAGMDPNAAAMSQEVFENITLCDEISELMQYTSPLETSSEEEQKRRLANYFGLSQILVSSARYDSAPEGATASNDYIWDDEYFTLLRVSTNPQNMKEPCFGKTLLWTQDSPDILNVDIYREDKTRSDIVRVRHQTAEHVVSASSAYILSNITA